MGGDTGVELAVDSAGYGVALVTVHASLSFHWTWLVRIAPDGT